MAGSINICNKQLVIDTSCVKWINRNCCLVGKKLCLTLCDPMDYSPPGSSVHEISQARIL